MVAETIRSGNTQSVAAVSDQVENLCVEAVMRIEIGCCVTDVSAKRGLSWLGRTGYMFERQFTVYRAS